jgi:multimeric flavodoxin WrbA
MKIVAFNGSPRREGNTFLLLRMVLEELEQAGATTELVQLAGRDLRGCTACGKCKVHQDRRCSITQDDANACIEQMLAADAILLGSPVHFTDVTPAMKALIDRAGFVARSNGDMLQRKVGAAVVAVRRAGAIHTFDTLNHFFLIGQMIVPGSRYWNVGIGREIGDVLQDAEGRETMQVLGRNIAWLLQRLAGE